MKKAEILNRWRGLKARQTIEADPIAYKHTGSTFDQDGIRITGSQGFIDSVLSNLIDLLKQQNGRTRLQLNYQQAQDKDTHQLLDSYCCYIQVHERGRESQMMNARYGIED